jgi:hypothetical protein
VTHVSVGRDREIAVSRAVSALIAFQLLFIGVVFNRAISTRRCPHSGCSPGSPV